MNELLAAFAAWREDLESVPFAHEEAWDQWSGDILKGSAP